MRIYETLGTNEQHFLPEDLWDGDEEALSEEGELVLMFANSHKGACSIDFGDNPEGDYVAHALQKLFTRDGLEHKVPADREWWEEAAHIAYDLYHNDSYECAKVFYCIDGGDIIGDVLNNADNVCDLAFEAVGEGTREEALKNAAVVYVDENYCCNTTEHLDGYIKWEEYAADNFTALAYAGGWIVTRDDS